MPSLRFLTLVLIILFNLKVTAQGANFVWAQRFGGNLNDNCWSGCDQSGNVYRLQGPALTKLNSVGNPVWSITTAYSSWQISFDGNGDVYLAGTYTGTIDLDHGPGTQTVSALGAIDRVIVKLSGTNGDFVWGGSTGSVNNDYEGIIFTDPAGNVYTGIYFTGVYDADHGSGVLNFTTSVTDFLVSKIDLNGNLVWAKQFAGNSTGYVTAIDVNSTGEIYFHGGFSGTVDFDPGAGTSNYSTTSTSDLDLFLGKLDASGNLLWLKQVGSSGMEYGGYLELGTNGNLYLSGAYTGLVDFDAGAGTLTLNSGTVTNGFIAEFSIGGTPNWVRSLDGYFVADMALDINNGICFTGQFKTADFDPGPGTFSMTCNGGSWPDIYISKLSSGGNFLWAKRMGSLNEDGPNTLSIDGSNNIHVAGRFKTTCDFDPNGGYYPLTASGTNFNYDAFMLKLCQTPDVLGMSGSTILCDNQNETYSVTVYSDAQTFIWTLPSGWTGSSSNNSIAINSGTTGGNIILKVGNSCGFSSPDTLQVTVSICTGIEEHKSDLVKLYPNPSRGALNIETSEKLEARVVNQLGEIVLEFIVPSGKNAFDFGTFSSGLYIIELSSGKQTQYIKLLLE